MVTYYKNVYQFKITLDDIKPDIWRRIQVPDKYTFEDLHYDIQTVMGWSDEHAHEFQIRNPKDGNMVSIGVPHDFDTLEERKQKIANFFSKGNSKAKYIYDFGDEWEHTVKFEKVLPIDSSVEYPICIAGERACPPEDCGGAWSYVLKLEIMRDKQHERYEEIIEWFGEDFNPEYFNKDEIKFW